MSLIRRIINHPYGRVLLESGILLCATYGTWGLTQWFLALLAADGLNNPLFPGLALSLAQCALPFVALYFCCRYLERRSLADIGVRLKHMPRDAGWGMLVSAGVMSLTVLLLARIGAYQFVGFCSPADSAALITSIIASISAPINEEIFFRGTLFRHLERYAGSWPALLISGLIFGFGHSWRPYATWHSSLFLAIDVGFLCAGLYMLTRSLWVPMGMHFAWNVCEELIYGLPNSGGASSVSLLHAVVQGPAWLTGGNFGPEASVIPFAICLLLNAIVFVLVAKKQTVIHWREIGKVAPITGYKPTISSGCE
jgi:membrane protease YdiL (CAAX protease family)